MLLNILVPRTFDSSFRNDFSSAMNTLAVTEFFSSNASIQLNQDTFISWIVIQTFRLWKNFTSIKL